MTTIALFGAAGNMGTRISNALGDDPEYKMLYVEGTEKGIKRLSERGLEASAEDDAVEEAEVVILAVPDKLVGRIAAGVVPKLNPGTLVICLDPAAPFGGVLPEREDISYLVTHPGHPPVFNDETDLEAKRDYFGSGRARQAIVSALMQGPEEHFELGEKIASKMFGPILRSHRVTVEQMALLEPALAETVAATCVVVMGEAMQEVIDRGVPEQAARDFLLGHINVELAIVFKEIDWDFSAGAKKAVEEARRQIFKADWKKVFEKENVLKSVTEITGGGS